MSLGLSVRQFGRASRYGCQELTRPAVAQKKGRCILLLREQARKVDFVRVTFVLDRDLEVRNAIDALLVLVPGGLVSLASGRVTAGRTPGYWDLPVVCLPLGDGIGKPVARDAEAAICLAILPGGDWERAFQERVEAIYLLLRYGEGKRG